MPVLILSSSNNSQISSSNVGITVNGVVSANAFAGNGAALTDITAVTANLLSTDSEAGQLSYNANDDIWTLNCWRYQYCLLRTISNLFLMLALPLMALFPLTLLLVACCLI